MPLIELQDQDCICGNRQQTRLFDTPIVLEDILRSMARHVFANRDIYPEVAKKFKQLETRVAKIIRKRVENASEAEALTVKRLRNAAHCLYRQSDIANDTPLRAKRAGEMIAAAAINHQELLAKFPEFAPPVNEPELFKAGNGYILSVKLHMIKCVLETSPTTLTDDIVIGADWTYGDQRGAMSVFENSFDDNTIWPPLTGPEWLVSQVSVERGRSSFIARVIFFEADWLDKDDAEFVAETVTFILDFAIEIGKGLLMGLIEEKVDNSSLSDSAKEAVKEAARGAVDKAGEVVQEEVEKDGQSWIAKALQHELFDPFPFGIRVNIDWSFPRLPPTWETWLNHVRVSQLAFAPGQFVSHELELTEKDSGRGKYKLQVSYSLYENAI